MSHINPQQQAHNAKRGVFSRSSRTALVKVVRGDEAANEPATWRCPDCCGLGCVTCANTGALPVPASAEDLRLAAMFAGDDDSLAVQNEGGKP